MSNSSAVEILSSRAREVLSFQARVPVDCYWSTVVSFSSSSEGKKSEYGLLFLECLVKNQTTRFLVS